MDDEIRARLPDTAGRRSSAARAARSTSTTSRSPSSRRRARSSSSRRRTTTPTPTSSRRCWPSPTTRDAGPSRTTSWPRSATPANLDVARMVGGDEAELVLVGDLIARIAAQTCRQSGLSIVYTELLDFDGDEIYFASMPELVGRTFGEALLAFEDSTADRPRAGRRRRRSSTRRWTRSSRPAIGSSSSARTTTRSGWRPRRRGRRAAIRDRRAATGRAPERTLVLGWNWRAPTIIGELDSYVAPGSARDGRRRRAGVEDGARRDFGRRSRNLTRRVRPGRHDRPGRARRARRRSVRPRGRALLLGHARRPARRRHDAHHAAPPARHRGDGRPRLLDRQSEMLDLRNRALAEVTRADDFIVSARLVSLLMAQVAENASSARSSTTCSTRRAPRSTCAAGEYVEPGSR